MDGKKEIFSAKFITYSAKYLTQFDIPPLDIMFGKAVSKFVKKEYYFWEPTRTRRTKISFLTTEVFDDNRNCIDDFGFT